MQKSRLKSNSFLVSDDTINGDGAGDFKGYSNYGLLTAIVGIIPDLCILIISSSYYYCYCYCYYYYCLFIIHSLLLLLLLLCDELLSYANMPWLTWKSTLFYSPVKSSAKLVSTTYYLILLLLLLLLLLIVLLLLLLWLWLMNGDGSYCVQYSEPD